MPRQEPIVEIREAEDAVTVCIAGDIDIANAQELSHAFSGVLEREPPPATVYADLAGVTFLDSAGLRELAAAHRAAHARGSRLALSRLSPPARRVLELSGLIAVLSGDENDGG